MKDYRNLATDIVKELEKQGADSSDVYIVTASNFDTNIRLGQIEKLERSISKGMGLRVFKNGATAITYTTDFQDKSVASMVRDLLDIVKVSNADEFNGLAPKDSLGVYTGTLELVDRSISNLSNEKKIELAKKAEEAGMQSDKRIVNSNGSSWSDGWSQVTLANSDGFVGQYETTGASISCALIAEADGVKQTDYWYSFHRHADRLESPEAVGKMAAKRSLDRLGGKKVKTQKAPVVVDPIVARRLISGLYGAANGSGIFRKSTFLVEKLGEQIASPLVTIIDDGTLVEGTGSRPFDAEGVKSSKLAVVEKGKLVTYICDAYSSRRLKMPISGKSSRSYQSQPSAGSTNLMMVPGDHAPEEIIKSVDNGLYLMSLSSQGFNGVTGDLSMGATGYWIEKGRLAYPVQEITIAGNFLDMLSKIEMVGNDLTYTLGSTITPTFLIGEATIGGS